MTFLETELFYVHLLITILLDAHDRWAARARLAVFSRMVSSIITFFSELYDDISYPYNNRARVKKNCVFDFFILFFYDRLQFERVAVICLFISLILPGMLTIISQGKNAGM